MDAGFPKLFKISFEKDRRHIRLATVVFIHPGKTPAQWEEHTAPHNTDKTELFFRVINDIKHDKGEQWRYYSDEQIDTAIPHRFYPRHLKIVYLTPIGKKVCLRPKKAPKAVFTVRRQQHSISVCSHFHLIILFMCLILYVVATVFLTQHQTQIERTDTSSILFIEMLRRGKRKKRCPRPK